MASAFYLMASAGIRLLECRGEEDVGTGLAAWRESVGVEDRVSKSAFPGPLDINKHLTYAV